MKRAIYLVSNARALAAAGVRWCLSGVAALLVVADVLTITEIFAPDPKCAINPTLALCALSEREALSAGLLGAAGAIFAGWLAWRGVQMQISTEQRRRTREMRSEAAGATDAIAVMLLQTATRIETRPQAGPPRYINQLLFDLILPAMKIDSRLGGALNVAIGMLSDLREQIDRYGEKRWDPEQPAAATIIQRSKIVASRLHIASTAFQAAAFAIEDGQPVSGPLVDEATIRELMATYGLEPENIGFMKLLTKASDRVPRYVP